MPMMLRQENLESVLIFQGKIGTLSILCRLNILDPSMMFDDAAKTKIFCVGCSFVDADILQSLHHREVSLTLFSKIFFEKLSLEVTCVGGLIPKVRNSQCLKTKNYPPK